MLTGLLFLDFPFSIILPAISSINIAISLRFRDERNELPKLLGSHREKCFGGGYCFTVENFGLSNQEGEASYHSGGAGSRKDPNGTLTAKFIDLDTYVARKNLPRVDYIKLDIEGAELDMLRGAAKTITRYKPKMAISAYHKNDDLWTLINYVKSLRSDYEFKFRHIESIAQIIFLMTRIGRFLEVSD